MEHPIDALQAWYLGLEAELRLEIALKMLGDGTGAELLPGTEGRFLAWLDEGREEPHRVLFKARQFVTRFHAEFGHKKDIDGWARGLTAMAILSARLRGSPSMAVLHSALSDQLRTAGTRQRAWEVAFERLALLTRVGGALSAGGLACWSEQEAGSGPFDG